MGMGEVGSGIDIPEIGVMDGRSDGRRRWVVAGVGCRVVGDLVEVEVLRG